MVDIEREPAAAGPDTVRVRAEPRGETRVTATVRSGTRVAHRGTPDAPDHCGPARTTGETHAPAAVRPRADHPHPGP